MSTPITKLYEALTTVFTGAISLSPSPVPKNNLRPGEDPSEPEAGNMIFYNLSSTGWNKRSRRGTGVLSVSVAAVGNNITAGAIMDIIREVLTARALTNAGAGVTVHMMNESEDYTDVGTTASDRWLAATSFNWKLVEAA